MLKTPIKNIKVAIKDLSRGSVPGVDKIPLDFYLVYRDEMAPCLSELFQTLLRRGELTPDMQRAVLSPVFKNKGERRDPTKYRPISVTTTEYRILAKCIAQRLNLAIPHLIGDPAGWLLAGTAVRREHLRGAEHGPRPELPPPGGRRHHVLPRQRESLRPPSARLPLSDPRGLLPTHRPD